MGNSTALVQIELWDKKELAAFNTYKKSLKPENSLEVTE